MHQSHTQVRPGCRNHSTKTSLASALRVGAQVCGRGGPALRADSGEPQLKDSVTAMWAAKTKPKPKNHQQENRAKSRAGRARQVPQAQDCQKLRDKGADLKAAF